jgi:hypothetical protein
MIEVCKELDSAREGHLSARALADDVASSATNLYESFGCAPKDTCNQKESVEAGIDESSNS